jgi:Fe-S cluster assembly protein SufD
MKLHEQVRAELKLADAAELLEDQALPDQHSEHWRYANLRALENVRRLLAVAPEPGRVIPTLPPALPGFERLVFIDGRRAPELGSARLAALHAAGLPAVAGDDDAMDPDTRFAMLARLFGTDTAALDNHSGDAIEVVFVSTGAPGAVYPRLQVSVDGSRPLRLVERHLGAPAADAMVCTQVQIELQAGATLGSLSTAGLRRTGAVAGYADAPCRRAGAIPHPATDGRRLTARSTASIVLAGAAAHVDWRGLAASHRRQVADLLVRVRHLAPATRTEQLFRGIAGDQSRIGFDADVQVQAEAVGARVKQSLRGLIDGKGASMNLRPRLTINTDDIQASHGATTGQLDDNLLFYLLSRGLDPDTARTLLKWAFLGDALAAIDIPPLRREAERAAAGHLVGSIMPELLA